MKAYIVFEEDYDWFDLLGIFTDKTKAVEFYNKYQTSAPVYVVLAEVPLNREIKEMKDLMRKRFLGTVETSRRHVNEESNLVTLQSEKRKCWNMMKLNQWYLSRELAKQCKRLTARELGIFLGKISKIMPDVISKKMEYNPPRRGRLWRKNKDVPFETVALTLKS